MLSVDDKQALAELVYRYGLATDARDWEALADVIADDAVFDVSALGGPTHKGLATIVEHLAQRSIPTAHLFANLIIEHDPDSAEQPAAAIHLRGMIPDPEGRVVVTSMRYHARRRDGAWRLVALVAESLLRPGPEIRR
ncbi:MAG: nuclear transport factor 2 family protein [Microbacteriaceae bacterium]